MALNDTAVADVVAAMGVLPEAFWTNQDDGCDCTYQRIGMWTNPFLGETLEVRMCCIWAELYKLFPQHVRVTSAFNNYNTGEWEPELRDWDGDDDMPAAIWYRHLARKHGVTVAEAREQYAHLSPPKGIPRPVVEAPQGPSVEEYIMTAMDVLAEEVARLRAIVEGQHEATA